MKVYQFKITLNVKPKVWRRIQILENSTFKDLHVAIQKSMGWQSAEIMYHLHKFEIENPKTHRTDVIGIYFEGDCMGMIPHEQVKIADYFISPNDSANYEYDFGIGWDHVIVLEEILPAVPGATYPQCLAGKWQCPPEDGVCDEDEDEDEGEGEPKEFDPKSVQF